MCGVRYFSIVKAKTAVVSAFTIAIVGGLLFLAVAFMGGPRIVWLNLKPGPDPEELTKERAQAFKALEVESDEAAQGSSFSEFAEARHDQCYEGQNDGKVDEGFAHRCTVKLTRYYGFNGDFRQQFLDLDRSLYAKGWVNRDDTLSVAQTLHEYFDGYHRQPNARTGEVYLVNNLPTPCYGKNDLELCVKLAERMTQDLFGLESFQKLHETSGPPEFEKKDLVDIRPLFKKITSGNEYMAAVSIQKDYFEN